MGSRGLQRRAGMAPDSPLPSWQEATKPASAIPLFFQLLCLSSPCAETPVPPGDKAKRSPCAPKLLGVGGCPSLESVRAGEGVGAGGLRGGCLLPNLGVSLMNCSCQSRVSRRNSS